MGQQTESRTNSDAGALGRPDAGGATLLVGGSGSLGGLAAAALLADAGRRLVLPLRSSVDPAAFRAGLRRALVERGLAGDRVDAALQRLVLLELPAPDRLADLDDVVSSLGVDELVNCAGSIDYYDSDQLRGSNIELTDRLLQAARRWRARRFIHLSTAYCSGYRDGLIPERLHPDPLPGDDPTEYTRTKRIAEWMVADSGVPFVIVRPSIVIGDSRTGAYSGKPSGLYQLLRATEGLLCSEYFPIWHMVAPPSRLNFVHQDAFQAGFLGIYRGAAPDTIVHLTGDHEQSPTMRDLACLWAEQCWPREIRLYARIEDVPLRTLPTRQRRFLELAAVNFDIASRSWHFETTTLDRLRANGVPFVDATLASVARCQQRFVEESARMQTYQRTYRGLREGAPRLVELYDRARWSERGVEAASTGAGVDVR
jgi:nucleoside-diphosphate-sugar epimerase